MRNGTANEGTRDVKAIRIFFMAVGAIWAIVVIVIGVGGTYLTHNPEEAAAYAVATMGVDQDAGLIDQAGQMADNYADARAVVRDAGDYQGRYRAERAQRAAAEQGWGGESVAPEGWSDASAGYAE